MCLADFALPGGVRSIAMSMSICLSVCSHNSKTTRPTSPIYSMLPVAVARSSSDGVAIRYDIMFSHNDLMGRHLVFLTGDKTQQALTGEISTKFCTTIKTGSIHCELCRGGSLLSMIALRCCKNDRSSLKTHKLFPDSYK